MRFDLRSIALLAFGIAFVGVASAQEKSKPDEKHAEAWRIVASRCAGCHSGDEPAGKLTLTSRAAAERGGENGPAIDAQSALEKQLLWQRIAAGEMPPNKPLNDRDRAIVREWLMAGGAFPAEPLDPNAFTTAERAGYDWWAIQPIRVHWPATSSSEEQIDRLVAEQLAAKKLAPSPLVDKASLIRRLTFDLTGLPPSPGETRAFVADDSPDAYEKLVDRLLASPAYGERQARSWLDVAHYGESDGYEYDRIRPNAWRYRDWVIDAFNNDLPYDQFVQLQIAGDVIRPTDHASVVAAGFLVHGSHDALLPAFEAQRKVMRQDELEDIVGLVGQTFLGLTVHCARCHDHKFDPLSQSDYYRMAAALGGVRRGEREVPPLPLPEKIAQQLDAARKRLNELTDKGRTLAKAALDRDDKVREGQEPVAKLAPTPMAAWNFTESLKDQVGELHCRLEGNAKQTPDGLVVDGTNAYAASAPLRAELKVKTLEAWVKVDDVMQRGGAPISVQSRDGGRFDAIVYGEREPTKWMAGSEGFVRTQSFQAPDDADRVPKVGQPVHVVIVYSPDGQITGYRNGEPYGRLYKSNGPQTFAAEQSEFVFGLRHAPVGGNKMFKGTIVRAAVYDRALSAEEVASAAAAVGKFITEKGIEAALGPELAAERSKLRAAVEQLEKESADRLHPKAFTVTPQEVPETHRLVRGNPATPRELVAPGGLLAVARTQGKSPDFAEVVTATEGERRIRLAHWVSSAENPLTARVMVNRIWQQHFGAGLVETPSDLGFNGGQPSHPELLDGLAQRFVESGWSMKSLHRAMVRSKTYRQRSAPRAEAMALDAGNRLLWRMPHRRLDAESVRDASLAVAGLLNEQRGGPSFQDFRAYVHKNSQYYEPLDQAGPQFDRRSIYRMWARGGRNPLLDTLDCPDPSVAVPKRGSTTTPLQALSMLNGDFLLRMADAMAARLEREAGDDRRKQVALACQLVWSRGPTESETEAMTRFAADHGLSPLCRVLLNTNAFLYVD